jgi:hypothetical protein
MYGKENVFLVSKAGSSIAEKTKIWLTDKKFFEKTMFLKENILFCKERAQKAVIHLILFN